MTKTYRITGHAVDRAHDFIENEKQFHLGFLPTGKGRGQTLSERKGQTLSGRKGDSPCLANLKKSLGYL